MTMVLILAAVAFMLVHALPATGLRPWLIRRIGTPGYLAGFSILSIGLLVVMALAYREAAPASPLWIAGPSLRIIIALFMLVAFWLAVAANSQRNPAAVGGGATLEESAAPRGVFTVTRHPLLVAIVLWGILHLIANADIPSLILFGSFIVTSIAGAAAQDRRKEQEIGAAWRRYVAQTSRMPFAAIVERRTRFDHSDITWWRVAITLALWLAFLIGHGDIFGVPVLM